jgi:hypothetical protein
MQASIEVAGRWSFARRMSVESGEPVNPILEDVPAAFSQVAALGHDVVIDRTGIALPEGGHFQGIQRLGGSPHRLVITSSSNSEAYLVVCDMTADGTEGRARPPTRLARAPLKHAGGCQTVREFLVVGVEDDDAKTTSEVQFWNLAASPTQQGDLTIRRRGPKFVSTAGAVGITSLGDGAVVAVASWNARTIDFYVCPTDPFGGTHPTFTHQRKWILEDADRSQWIDGNFGVYESINLVTDVRDSPYLVGFNRNDDDEDWMDLYTIDLEVPRSRTLKKVGKKHMFCTSGCSFRFGSGIYILSSTRLEVYVVNGSSGPHGTGRTIHANHFP